MLGRTPPWAMVTPPKSLFNSSSLRMASWKWRGMIQVFKKAVKKTAPADGKKKRQANAKRASASTSTRSWSKSTPTPVFPARQWASWTHLSTTSSSELQLKHLDLLITTNVQPSAVARFKPLSVCYCPVNWPSTPSLKAPRPSPSTPAPNKFL